MAPKACLAFRPCHIQTIVIEIEVKNFSDSSSETCKVTRVCTELSMLRVGIFLTEECEREGSCTL